MKKFEISLMVIVILMLSLVGTVSAAGKVIHVEDKDDVNDILKEKFNDKYGVEKVTDTILWVIPDKRAEYSLTSNTEQCLTECEAYGEAVLYKNTKLFDSINFKDKLKTSKTVPYQVYIKDNRTFNVTDYTLFDTICNSTFENETEKDCYNTYNETQTQREVQEEYWKPYNSENLPEGHYKWKIVGKKGINENIDFIPISNELELSDWAWWNNSWQYRREIIINSTVVSTLTDYTPYFVLDTATLIAAGKMSSNCSDLRFLDKNNITELNYEIQLGTCNTSNTIVWTRIPSLTSGNYSIYAFYGNPAAPDNQNLAGVWQNYTFVFHHNGNKVSKPEGTRTLSAAVTETTDSWLTGDNSTFHDTGAAGDDMLVIPNPGSFTHDFSKGFYLYWRIKNQNNLWDNTAYPLDFAATGISVNIIWCGSDSGSGQCDTATDHYGYGYTTLGGGSTTKISTDFGYTDWHMIGFTGNTNDNAAWTYVDGTFNTRAGITYTTGSATLYADGTQGSGIGQTGTGNQGAWKGYIGETRLGEFNATADWIKADYAQLNWISTTEEELVTSFNLTSCKNDTWLLGRYTLLNDVDGNQSGDNACFNFNVSNIILDLNGHTITGNDSGYGFLINGYNNITILNGTFKDYFYGMGLINTANNTLRGVTITSSAAYSAIFGANVNYNKFENMAFIGGGINGIYITTVSYSYNNFTNVTIIGGSICFGSFGGSYNRFENVSLTGCSVPLYSNGGSNNVWNNLKLSGEARLQNAPANNFTNVSGGGFQIRDGSVGNIFSNASISIVFWAASSDPSNNIFYNLNTTSITSFSSWNLVTGNRLIYNNSNGMIDIILNQSVSTTSGQSTNLGTNIIIENNYAYLNNATISGLNLPSNITFKNMPGNFGGPYIKRNGQPCGSSCIAFTSLNAPTVLFQVPGWSNYTLDNDTVAPYFTTIPANASLWYKNESLSVQFDANDSISSFVNYSINDTKFSMTVFLNGTGILKNATSLPSNKYAINVVINDSINTNSTIYLVEVNKSTYNCGVYFNTTSPITYPNTFSVTTDCSSAYTLTRNGTTISNNSEQKGAGYYNFVVQRTDTVNYTNTYDSEFFTINPSTDSCGVYFNATSPLNFPDYFIAYTNCTSAYTLSVNGTSIPNGTAVNSGAGAYNVSVQRTDVVNYTNRFDQRQFIIIANAGNCDVLINTTSQIEYPNTFLVWSNCNSAFTLRRNNTIISNNTEQVLGVSAYNFSVQRTGGSNYTNFYDDMEVRVVDTTAPTITIRSPIQNIIYYIKRVLFDFSISDIFSSRTRTPVTPTYNYNGTNLSGNNLIVTGSVSLGGNLTYDNIIIYPTGTITVNATGYLNLTARNFMYVYGTINGDGVNSNGYSNGGTGGQLKDADEARATGGGGAGANGTGGNGGFADGDSSDVNGGTGSAGYMNAITYNILGAARSSVGGLAGATFDGPYDGPGEGGNGGGNILLKAPVMFINGTVTANGSGGTAGDEGTQGSNNAAGGGGGGSGGKIVLQAGILNISKATITSGGGTGGPGDIDDDGFECCATGGGGGGGGAIVIAYKTSLENTSLIINRNGGIGGNMAKDTTTNACNNGATGNSGSVYYVNDINLDVNDSAIYQYQTLRNGVYNLTVWANDSSQNYGVAYIFNFTVQSINVSLLYPYYNAVQDANPQTFIGLAASADTLVNMTLYTNQTGWSAIYTNTTNATNMAAMYANVSGPIIWNILTCDTTGDCLFSPVNFTLNEDLVYPTISITAPQPIIYTTNYATSNLTSIPFNWNAYDSTISKCTYTNISSGLNITGDCNNMNTTFFVPFGTYTIRAYANDSFLHNTSASVTSIHNIAALQTSVTYNPTTYETKNELFSVNLITNGTAPTNAYIFYNGIPYTATITNNGGSTYTINRTIPVGNTAGTYPVIFNFKIGTTTINSTTINQIVYPTAFILCNVTTGFNTPYLNLNFKNETDNLAMSGIIDAMSVHYWIDDASAYKVLIFANSTANLNYNFCFSPNTTTVQAEIDLKYSNTGFPQRSMSITQNLTNTQTNKTLLLLASGTGLYSIYQTTTTGGTIIQGVNILVERQIASVWNTIEMGTTDSAGSATFWLNPDYDHRLTFSKAGYNTQSFTIRPSSSTYTVIMTTGLDNQTAIFDSTLAGLTWIVQPSFQIFNPNTVYNFSFTISSYNNNLTAYALELYDNDNLMIGQANGTGTQGTVSILLNTLNNQSIRAKLLINNGVAWYVLDADPFWRVMVQDIPTRGTLSSFFSHITSEGLKGTADEVARKSYTRTVIFFLLLFIVFGFLSINGWDVSGATFYLLLPIIWFASFGGFFTMSYNSLSGDTLVTTGILAKHMVAIIATLFIGGFIFNQLSKENR